MSINPLRAPRVPVGHTVAPAPSDFATVRGDSAPQARGLVSLGTSGTEKGENTITLGKYRAPRKRRSIVSGADLITSGLQKGGYRYTAWFQTLTYRPGACPIAGDIITYMDCVSSWAKRRGYRLGYVWSLEYGSINGRPHYHVILWLPKGATPPKPDKQRWWQKGDTNSKRTTNPVHYAAKYTAKEGSACSSDYDTKGLRQWGIGGMSAAQRMRWRIHNAPSWVRDKWRAFGGDDCQVRKLQYGWWRVGQWEFRSPWQFLGMTPLGEVRLMWRGWSVRDFEVSPSGS